MHVSHVYAFLTFHMSVYLLTVHDTLSDQSYIVKGDIKSKRCVMITHNLQKDFWQFLCFYVFS